jgi:hypothetical protein
VKARTLLELGRVSNLPTVVSNVLCGAALAGEALRPLSLGLAVVAGCLFYVGGMFLNDAFDAAIDAKERPERPIPSGRARRETVLGIGFGLLAAGEALLAVAAPFTPAGPVLLLVGWLTASAVIAYDRWHKGLALSPVVMGLCRAGLYLMGAFAVSLQPDYGAYVAAFTLLLYVVGLTHIARFENASAVGRVWPTLFVFSPLALALTQPIARVHAGYPMLALATLSALWSLRSLGFARAGGRNIGRAVVTLIAGISLVDAVFAASRAGLLLAGLSVLCFGLTLLGQRAIRGT